jgi:hypothetical protein
MRKSNRSGHNQPINRGLNRLVVDAAENLYGTKHNGTWVRGTVYRISYGKKGWKMTILSSFKTEEHFFGAPGSAVTLDAGGNIYGTTPNPLGTVYELTAGSYTRQTLWSFDGTDGYSPFSSMVLDGEDNLYGVTVYGGPGYEPEGTKRIRGDLRSDSVIVFYPRICPTQGRRISCVKQGFRFEAKRRRIFAEII